MWLFSISLFIFTTVVIGFLDFHFQKSIYKTAEYPVLISAGFFLIPTIYGFLFRADFINVSIIPTSLLVGLICFVSFYGYFKAVFSYTTPWFIQSFGKLQVVFAFGVGTIFFWEHLGHIQLLGHIIILLWVAAISFSHFLEHKSSQGLAWTSLMVVAGTVTNIFLKYLYIDYEFWTIFIPFCGGISLGGIFTAIITRGGRNFLRGFIQQPILYLGTGIITETFGVAQFYFKNLSLKTWPYITSVFLFETCVIFTILISIIFHPIIPKYIPEEGGKNKILNIIIISVMFGGIWLALKTY